MLNALCDLYPMFGVLHVGAGYGASADHYRKCGVRQVGFVEADVSRAQQLRATLEGQKGFFVLNAVVAGKAGESTPFFVASNRNESGLVEPQILRRIWRNLETLARESRPATTIAELLDENAGRWEQSGPNWMVIDCLPALTLLQGAGRHLNDWDVVLARVVLNEQLARLQPELGKPALDAFMARHDFRSVVVESERNSSVAQVAYMRDWKRRLQPSLLDMAEQQKQQALTLSAARDEQAKHAQQLAGELEAAKAMLAKAEEGGRAEAQRMSVETKMLAAARDEQAKRAQQLAGELEAAKATLARAEECGRTEAQRLAAEMKTLVEARDEQAVLASKKAEEFAALVREHGEHSERLRNEAADVVARADQVAKQLHSEQSAATQLKEQLKVRETQNAELVDKVSALEKRVKELTQELSVVQDEARQERARLEKEFARAEAQIDLIRSLWVNPAVT